jgi:hypothetical protein
MTLTVSKYVTLVLLLAAFHVLMIAAPFSSSRRHRQIADTVVSLGLAAMFAFTATGLESKWRFALSGLVIGMWAVRTARFFMRRKV